MGGFIEIFIDVAVFYLMIHMRAVYFLTEYTIPNYVFYYQFWSHWYDLSEDSYLDLGWILVPLDDE